MSLTLHFALSDLRFHLDGWVAAAMLIVLKSLNPVRLILNDSVSCDVEECEVYSISAAACKGFDIVIFHISSVARKRKKVISASSSSSGNE